MKSIILVFVISAVHYFISIWLSMKSFANVYAYFDTRRELTAIDDINNWVVEILFFPIVTIFENSSYEGASVVAQYIPFILNSMLWGIVIVFVYKLISNRN